MHGVHVVGGSNPLTPTNFLSTLNRSTASFNKRDEFGPTLVYVLMNEIDESTDESTLRFKRHDLLPIDQVNCY